jgi:hypothetical protein
LDPFTRLPGFVRSAPGLEWRLWRRLPAVFAWGTAVPLAALVALRLVAPDADWTPATVDLWDYGLIGVVTLHWSAVLTVALGCVIVMVMKGPAYVADAYPMTGRARAPERPDASSPDA